MKILVTHEVFPPEQFGGGEKIVWELIKRLLDNGFDIEVLTTGNPKIKEYEGIPTHRIPVNRFLMNFAVRSIVKHSKNVDLVQASTYNAWLPSYLGSKITKKPVVALVMGLYDEAWFEMRGPIFGELSRIVEKIQLFHNYDKVVFFSNFSRNLGLKMGMNPEITEIIPPGVDHKKCHVDKKEDFVFFAGRLAKQKGVEYLIGAAKEMPNIKFKLAGTGELEKHLKSIATPNVEFLGHLTGKIFYDMYAKAPIFCLPSTADAFGLVVPEAMASGCAVVSTIPLDYSGIRIESESTKSIVNAINRLWNNPNELERMGKENMEKSKKYDWDKFTKSMIKIYDGLV